MAKIYYKNRFIQPNKYTNWSTDIYNWRYIKDETITQDNGNIIFGVIIHLNHALFLPYLEIDNVHYLNRAHGKEERVEQFYIEYGTDTLLCEKCWGKGKLDWVENARDERNDYKVFIRDPSSAMIYPKYTRIIFARALLDEGEDYCPNCLGTGLILDGRHKLFKGMTDMRNRLLPIQFKG